MFHASDATPECARLTCPRHCSATLHADASRIRYWDDRIISTAAGCRRAQRRSSREISRLPRSARTIFASTLFSIGVRDSSQARPTPISIKPGQQDLYAQPPRPLLLRLRHGHPNDHDRSHVDGGHRGHDLVAPHRILVPPVETLLATQEQRSQSLTHRAAAGRVADHGREDVGPWSSEVIRIDSSTQVTGSSPRRVLIYSGNRFTELPDDATLDTWAPLGTSPPPYTRKRTGTWRSALRSMWPAKAARSRTR